MKKSKILFNAIITILSVIVVLLNLFIFYTKVILKSDIVNVFGYSVLIVVSGSMEPNISIDDLIIIKQQETYYLDDIVTYKNNNSLVTHRIVRIDGEDIFAKGDSNNTEDKPIKEEQIKGKVIYTLKGVGKVFNETTLPFIIVICVFIILITQKKQKDDKMILEKEDEKEPIKTGKHTRRGKH